MSKIKIKTIIKSDDEEVIYEGLAIKKGNEIMYNDSDTLTKITIDDVVTVERKKDYDIKIRLKEGEKLKGSYNTMYGSFKLEALAKSLKKHSNGLEIIYDLIISDKFSGTFTFICEYSIDS